MNFKKCKNCGKAVPEGNFCDQCGSPMTGVAVAPPPSDVPTVVLRQVEGGDACFELRPDTIVGRTQGDYTRYLGRYKFISGRHARISYSDEEGWTVTDLGSTNGTYVNDDRLTKDVPHTFQKGDVIDFGTMIFEVE